MPTGDRLHSALRASRRWLMSVVLRLIAGVVVPDALTAHVNPWPDQCSAGSPGYSAVRSVSGAADVVWPVPAATVSGDSTRVRGNRNAGAALVAPVGNSPRAAAGFCHPTPYA